jgi:hypothetical protein
MPVPGRRGVTGDRGATGSAGAGPDAAGAAAGLTQGAGSGRRTPGPHLPPRRTRAATVTHDVAAGLPRIQLECPRSRPQPRLTFSLVGGSSQFRTGWARWLPGAVTWQPLP